MLANGYVIVRPSFWSFSKSLELPETSRFQLVPKQTSMLMVQVQTLRKKARNKLPFSGCNRESLFYSYKLFRQNYKNDLFNSYIIIYLIIGAQQMNLSMSPEHNPLPSTKTVLTGATQFLVTSSKFVIPEKVCFHSQLTPVQYVSKTNTIRIDGLCYYQDTWSAVAAANGCSAFKGFMMTPSISPYSLASLALMKKSRSVSWLIFSKLWPVW